MRARLQNEDGSFLAVVEVPDVTEYIRYGERLFDALPLAVDTLPTFQAVDVYVAPIEGSSQEA